MVKRCFKCGSQKLLSEFYAHKMMSDGHLNKCKECTKRDVSANYDANRAHYRQYELARNQLESRLQQRREYNKRRQVNSPEKYRARYLTRSAIRDGRLIQKPCEMCGTTEQIQAHHPDYSRPLDVKWLCFRCHREHEHGQKVGT